MTDCFSFAMFCDGTGGDGEWLLAHFLASFLILLSVSVISVTFRHAFNSRPVTLHQSSAFCFDLSSEQPANCCATALPCGSGKLLLVPLGFAAVYV